MSAEPRVVQARIAEGAAGVRADSYIADTLGLFSRSQAKRRIVRLLVNGRPAKLSKRLRAGDELWIEYADTPAAELLPEPIPLDILYEDGEVLVVHKPQGMVVHPASGNWSGTLVNALLHHCGRLAERFPGEQARPGIVHRLDKGTSGVLITAKSPESRDFLARQFRLRKAGKLYLAIVQGELPLARGRIEARIARDRRHRQRFRCVRSPAEGKRAVTLYRVLKRRAGHNLVLLQPKTGRTHQLRVHLASLACPIVGDTLYGGRATASLMLHALKLRIRLPGESAERTFVAPLPARFLEYWRSLAAG